MCCVVLSATVGRGAAVATGISVFAVRIFTNCERDSLSTSLVESLPKSQGTRCRKDFRATYHASSA